MHTLLYLLTTTQHIALAGGGGSGGGGGGGGGGSYGGSGGGASGPGSDVLFAIFAGLFASHLGASWTRRFTTPKINGVISAGAGMLACVIIGHTKPVLGLVGLIGVAFGVFTGVYNVTRRVQQRFFRSSQRLQIAASIDPAWNEEAVQAYLTPQYYADVQFMLAAMQQMGRRNIVAEPQLLAADAVDVIDAPNNAHDQLSIRISGWAIDQLVDAGGATLYSIPTNFWELWWFQRSGDTWNLARIEQYTADVNTADNALQSFAQRNGMFYSLDWGRLLLPQRGQLFRRASFTRSDVNNEVIGNWGGKIVQLYTYAMFQGGPAYLVAQMGLPKSYGGILIRRKSSWSWLRWPPRGYRRVSMEWPDFNARYTVDATDVDQVTSFELLNPKFMADLYDKQLPFNIEVSDNVVYLYAQQTAAMGMVDRYAVALGVLQAAYKELYR